MHIRLTTRISRLLVELDLLGSSSRSSSRHGATGSTSSSSASLWDSTSSPPLLRHHATIWHRVASTTTLHHGISRPLSSTASWHHLWHCHGIGRLHSPTGSRPLHVHGHTRIAHGTSHGTTHHTGLAGAARTTSASVLCLQLRTSDFTALGQSNKDGLVAPPKKMRRRDGKTSLHYAARNGRR